MKKLFTTFLFIIIGNILPAQNNRALFPQAELNKTSLLVLTKYPQTKDVGFKNKTPKGWHCTMSALRAFNAFEKVPLTKMDFFIYSTQLL